MSSEQRADLDLLFAWMSAPTFDPKNGATPENVANWVKALAKRCSELCEFVPTYEEMKADLVIARNAVHHYRAELDRLRRELGAVAAGKPVAKPRQAFPIETQIAIGRADVQCEQ